MRTITTLAWAATVLLGVSLAGCDPVEGQTELAEDLKGQVELTPVQDMAAEGEVVSFTVKNGQGQQATHEYVVHNGQLEPIGDAPEMTLPESHELGVIPVSINGGSSYVSPASQDRGPSESVAGSWSPSGLQSSVPEIRVDSNFRIETGDFVRQLQVQGRNVETTPFATTGPSQATELSRLEIDGIVRAEIYQFDSAQNLDAWYRVAYQLHESVGHDPDERIRINGMTLLRLGDNADEEIAGAFLASERLSIQNR